MPKSTVSYWNPLLAEHASQWELLEGLDQKVEQLTLAIDENGDYTRLTRFRPGADTSVVGPKSHDYPEEIFVVQGRLYDAAFDCWLEQGHYASRPPGEVHGPFRTEGECLVLEISFPSQAMQGELLGEAIQT